MCGFCVCFCAFLLVFQLVGFCWVKVLEGGVDQIFSMCLRKCHQHDDIEDGHWYWGGSVEKIKILTCRDCHHVFIMCSSSFIIQSSIINHQSSHSFSRYKCIYINIFIPTSFPMSSPSSTHLHACWYNGYDYPAVEIGYHPPRGPKASLETVARHDETWGCTYTFE